MEVKTIFIFVIIVVLLILVFRYVMTDVNTLSGLSSAQNMIQIQAADLAPSDSGSTSNFSYSIWFYVDDWNYRYGEPKVIFGRMTTGTGQNEPCPSVVLGPVQNNIIVSLAVYPGLDEQPAEGTNFTVHNCSIANVPIQRWSNLTVSTYGRTLDLYLDGKLVRTCVLPGVAKVSNTAPLYITPNGGFSGYTSNINYYANSLNPQEAYNIYRDGYGGSAFNFPYKLKIEYLKDGKQQGSVTI